MTSYKQSATSTRTPLHGGPFTTQLDHGLVRSMLLSTGINLTIRSVASN